MPYEIKKEGDQWTVVNTRTGETKATHDSEEKAKRQVRLLERLEHEWSGGSNG